MDFWQFSKNAYIHIIPEKLSGNHCHAWLFSNLCGQVLKSIKSRGQISPITFKKKKDFSTWIREQPCMQMDFWQFSRNKMYVRNPFACIVVHHFLWKGPNHCWNFMDSGSPLAQPFLFIFLLILIFFICHTSHVTLDTWHVIRYMCYVTYFLKLSVT